jgi:Fe-S-cluster containining protein
MPKGKPAGVRCIHLQEDYSCGIYELRPKVCRDFKAEELVCGNSREEALGILSRLESESELKSASGLKSVSGLRSSSGLKR